MSEAESIALAFLALAGLMGLSTAIMIIFGGGRDE